MKRPALCLVILFLCFAVCFYSYKHLERVCLDMDEILSTCVLQIKDEDYEAAITTADSIEQAFQEHNRIIGIIVGDEIVETLHNKIPSIKYHIEDSNIQKALEIIRECQSALSEIPKGEKISIDNIF